MTEGRTRPEKEREREREREKERTAAEGQSSDSFSANCLSPMRQNCGKTKTAPRHTVTQLTKHFCSYGGATPRNAEKKAELDGGKQAAPFKGIRQSVGNRLFAQWHAA